MRFRPVSLGEVYVRVHVGTAGPPWTRDAGVLPVQADRDAALRVRHLDFSDWIEIPGLARGGTVTLSFEPQPIDAVMARVEVASAPDDTAVLRGLDFNEAGRHLTLVIPAGPAANPAEIVSARTLIVRRHDLVRQLRERLDSPPRPAEGYIGPALPGGAPTLASPSPTPASPIAKPSRAAADQDSTGGGNPSEAGDASPAPWLPLVARAPAAVGKAYADHALLAQEVQTLRLLGFNGMSPLASDRARPGARERDRAAERDRDRAPDRDLWTSPLSFPVWSLVGQTDERALGRGENLDAATMSLVDSLACLDERLPRAGVSSSLGFLHATNPARAAPSAGPGGGGPVGAGGAEAKAAMLAFRAYLAARGLRPADFAVASLDRVQERPDHSRLLAAAQQDDPAIARAAVNALTWTSRYHAYAQSHALSALVRPGLRRETAGRDAPLVAGFVDRPLIVGGGLAPGPLGPELDASGAEGETIDFWPDDATRRRWIDLSRGLHLGPAYLLDYLRGSCANDESPPPALLLPWSADARAWRVRTMVALAHGAGALQSFDFAPPWTADARAAALVAQTPTGTPSADAPAPRPDGSDPSAEVSPREGAGSSGASGSPPGAPAAASGNLNIARLDAPFAARARAVMRLAADLAQAGPHLAIAKPAPRAVALIHVADAELWSASWPVAIDRRMLHHTLVSEQYESDVLSDQSALARDLSGYRVIYLTDTQIPAALLEKLRQWVSAGGWLCLGAQAATEDEAGRPSAGLSELIGADVFEREPIDPAAASEAIAFQSRAGVPAAALPREARVSRGLRSCRFETTQADRVLATFADGSPAAVLRGLGKGQVVSLAYSPGLSVFHQIESPAGGIAPPPPAAVAAVTFPCRAAGVARAVEPSSRLLCAGLLVGERTSLVLLADPRPKPLANLTLRIAASDVRAVRSLRHGPLPFTTAPGRTVLTLPSLDQTDIVLLSH